MTLGFVAESSRTGIPRGLCDLHQHHQLLLSIWGTLLDDTGTLSHYLKPLRRLWELLGVR